MYVLNLIPVLCRWCKRTATESRVKCFCITFTGWLFSSGKHHS